MPRLDDDGDSDLPTIGGQPPNLADLPAGCAFAERCVYRRPECLTAVPALRAISPTRQKACILEHLP